MPPKMTTEFPLFFFIQNNLSHLFVLHFHFPRYESEQSIFSSFHLLSQIFYFLSFEKQIKILIIKFHVLFLILHPTLRVWVLKNKKQIPKFLKLNFKFETLNFHPMAPKRSLFHLDDPPTASPSEEEEEASSEEEDEEASGSEYKKLKQAPPLSSQAPTTLKKNPPKKADSSSASGSSSSSSSDSTVKPKPKPVTASAKQAPGESEAKASKKPKGKESEPGEDESKKLLFQRVWSEEDEIVILKGMIDYVAKRGLDPSGDMNSFHDFIKKSLQIDCSKTQLADKVRRLKKKFENNSAKKKKNLNPHEGKVFELSKRIWDPPKANGPSQRGNTSRTLAFKDVEKLDIDWLLGVDKCLEVFGLPRGGLDLISEPKKAEFEAKWKKIQVAELEVFVEKIQLLSDQAKLIVEEMKSADH